MMHVQHSSLFVYPNGMTREANSGFPSVDNIAALLSPGGQFGLPQRTITIEENLIFTGHFCGPRGLSVGGDCKQSLTFNYYFIFDTKKTASIKLMPLYFNKPCFNTKFTDKIMNYDYT